MMQGSDVFSLGNSRFLCQFEGILWSLNLILAVLAVCLGYTGPMMEFNREHGSTDHTSRDMWVNVPRKIS